MFNSPSTPVSASSSTPVFPSSASSFSSFSSFSSSSFSSSVSSCVCSFLPPSPFVVSSSAEKEGEKRVREENGHIGSLDVWGNVKGESEEEEEEELEEEA
eukprot:gb/GEZN01013827.1/.p1 GENE.gb/GEZN01013827.1/~~gb/GEZN01013827.1/.p1  ORF type:complete len:100 (-),score=52.29 gb/GEZN01013827.1/:22-321(-)